MCYFKGEGSYCSFSDMFILYFRKMMWKMDCSCGENGVREYSRRFCFNLEEK